MGLFIDSGAGLVLSAAHFSPSIQQLKQVYNCEASNVGVVYKEQMNHFHVNRRLLTNRLHDKVAEFCLANH